MSVCGRQAHYVLHLKFPRRKSIRHKRSVTAPRHRFSAHQGAGLSFGEVNRTRKSSLEFGRLHVIREAAETCIVPTDVFGTWFSVAQPAKRLEVRVPYFLGSQRRAQSFAVILRVTPRPRYRTDVDHALNSMRAQQFDQLFESTSRVAYSKNCTFFRLPRLCMHHDHHTAMRFDGSMAAPVFFFSVGT